MAATYAGKGMMRMGPVIAAGERHRLCRRLEEWERTAGGCGSRLVADRVRDEEDLERIRAAFPDMELVVVPEDPAVQQAEREGLAPLDAAPNAPAVHAIPGLVDVVNEERSL